MNPCLTNIISIKGFCDTDDSLSGVDLFDLPGLSKEKAASISDTKYTSGKVLLEEKVRIATQKLKTDMMAFLWGNGYVGSSIDAIYKTGDLRTSDRLIPPSNAGDFRGVNIQSVLLSRCILKKLFVSYVYVKSNEDIETTLRIEDGEDQYDYTVTLHAGAIDRIKINQTFQSGNVSILLPDSLEVYSVEPDCGCGKKSNGCAKVYGIAQNVATNQDSYGIWADVQCICDYEQLLCQLATIGLLGEILKYGAGVEIMDEAIKTDRLSYITVYGKEDAQATKQEWSAEYASLWNTLINSLHKVLPNIDKCGCIQCHGTQILSNV